jgi:hypothetical protein
MVPSQRLTDRYPKTIFSPGVDFFRIHRRGFRHCYVLKVYFSIKFLCAIFLVPCCCTPLLENRGQSSFTAFHMKPVRCLDLRRHVNQIMQAVRFRRIRGGFWKCFGGRVSFVRPSSAITMNKSVSEKIQQPTENQINSESALTEAEGLNHRGTSDDEAAMATDALTPLPYSIHSNMAESEELIAKEGWLFKKDHSLVRTWQRRYVIVRHGCLTYYEHGKEVGGETGRDIPLLHCTIQEKGERNWLQGVHFTFAFAIIIDAKLASVQHGRPGGCSGYSTYVFAASDALDRSRWVCAVHLPPLVQPTPRHPSAAPSVPPRLCQPHTDARHPPEECSMRDAPCGMLHAGCSMRDAP